MDNATLFSLAALIGVVLIGVRVQMLCERIEAKLGIRDDDQDDDPPFPPCYP